MTEHTPAFTQKVHFVAPDSAEEIFFLLQCKNVPAGSAVSFYAEPALPDGKEIALPMTVAPDSSAFTVGVTAEIPAGLNLTFYYSWYANGHGGHTLPGFTMSFNAVLGTTLGSDTVTANRYE